MPKKRKIIPQVLFPEDLDKIFNVILKRKCRMKYKDYSKFYKVRDIIALYFMYWAGLRPSECLNAKANYLNLDKKTFYIPAMSNKQRFEDTIYLPDFIIDKLYSYLVLRHKLFPNNDWLFPTSHGQSKLGRISRSTMSRIFRKALRDSGLLKVSYIDGQNKERHNFTLYSLRHSYGTIVYARTRDIRKTATLLRHRDGMARTTLTYIHTTQSLENKEIIKEVFPQDIFKNIKESKDETQKMRVL